MRILTVNLPVSYLEAIKKLVGVIYPSRSELIRVAVRNFLIREIESAKSFIKYQPREELDENLFDQVHDKTYKLVKK